MGVIAARAGSLGAFLRSVVAAPSATVFSEPWTGTVGTAWTASGRWTTPSGSTGGTANVQTGTLGRITTPATAYASITRQAVFTPAANMDVLTSIRMASTGAEQYAWVNVDDASPITTQGVSSTGIQLLLSFNPTSTSSGLQFFQGTTAIGSGTSKTLAGATTYGVRVQRDSTGFRARVWTGTEPSTWDLNIPLSSLPTNTNPSGVVGLGATSGGDAVSRTVDFGVVTVTNARPYLNAADWFWNPIPASPVLAANSATWGGYFAAAGTQHSLSVYDYGTAVVTAAQAAAATRYSITLSQAAAWGDPFPGMTTPVPTGLKIPPLTTTYGDPGDGHFVVADAANNRILSFWQGTPATNPRSATYGGLAALDGDGRETAGSSTATNITMLASVVTIAELTAAIAAGTGLGRTLVIASDISSGSYVYPAQKSDGDNAGGVATPIPQGSRIQLNPATSLTGVTNPIELVIARTLQTHGAVIGDKGGARISIVCEFPQDGNPGAFYNAQGVYDYYNCTQIPWSGIRVLNSWNGT